MPIANTSKLSACRQACMQRSKKLLSHF